MIPRMIHTSAEVLSAGPVPDELVQQVKAIYDKSGVPQVFLKYGTSMNVTHSVSCSEHWEEALSYRGERSKRGKNAVDKMLESINLAIKMVGPRFHLRHSLREYSEYLTLCVVEEKRRASYNGPNVGYVRALLDSNDITVFGHSVNTAKELGVPVSASREIGYNRYQRMSALL